MTKLNPWIILFVFIGLIFSGKGFGKEKEAALMLPVQNGVWRQVDPGGSGGTLEFMIHPVSGTLLVSSDMGRSLLKSTDGGRNYTAVSPDGQPTIGAIVPHPSKAGVWYAGFSGERGQGLYKSTDDGLQWEFVQKNREIARNTLAGIVISAQEDILVWLIKEKGPVISRDGGRHFEGFSHGLPMGKLPKVKKNLSARSPLIAIPQPGNPLMFLAMESGLFQRRLTDSAWIKTPGSPEAAIGTLAYDPETKSLWAGTGRNEIHVLDLRDGNWSKIPSPAGAVTILKTHPDKPGWLWCFSHGRTGLFRTRDRGKTWEWLTRRALTANETYKGNVPRDFRHRYKFVRDYFFIHPKNPDHIILGDMYLSPDGGRTWQFSATAHDKKTNAWKGRGLTLLTSYRAFWDNINPNRVYLGFSDTGLMQSRDRGKSVLSFWSSKYPDLYALAYWSRQMLETSGSCMAFAADPDFPSTQFYGMSGKGGKNNTSGMLFKTITSGRQWAPVLPETSGLPNGIINDIHILPGKGFGKRELFVVVNHIKHDRFPLAGIYHSSDNGNTFRLLADSSNSVLSFPLMNLDYCRDHPDTFYAAASSEGGKRPANTLRKMVKGQLDRGGVFKSTDKGKTWTRAGGFELSGTVQVAVHPRTPDIAYAAVVQGKAASKAEAFVKQGGIYKTTDGGGSWDLVLGADRIFPAARENPRVYPTSVAVNPEFPEIVYASVNRAGVFRSLDNGRSWKPVDWEHLKKFQGFYHTLTINPHDPAEFYLSLFGNSFLAYRDPAAARAMEKKPPALVLNGDFENITGTGRPAHWAWNNLSHPGPDSPAVLSIQKAPGKKGHALRIKIKGSAFQHPGFTGSKKGPITFISTRLTPYAMSRVRGRRVKLSYDIYSRRFKRHDTPVLTITGSGEFPKRLIAELPARLAYSKSPGGPGTIKKDHPLAEKWLRTDTDFFVSPRAKSLDITLMASEKNLETDIFIDNITLSMTGAGHDG